MENETDEKNVLSTEEVDALLNAMRTGGSDASVFANTGGADWKEGNCTINKRAMTNISELTAVELENKITSFLRKKISVKFKSMTTNTLGECLSDKLEKHVYSVFKLNADNFYGMAVLNLPVLHYVISILYGGKVNESEQVMEKSGKVGLIIAEKICQLCLDAFAQGSADYGNLNYEIIKTINIAGLTSKLNMDERVQALEFSIYFDSIETSISLMVKEEFFSEFIPVSLSEGKHLESNFWRSAIESQVVDSYVTVNVALPNVNMKVNELMALKAGDLIPIGDPTFVYVCLNNVKLYRANAGQANSKRVAKILSEI